MLWQATSPLPPHPPPPQNKNDSLLPVVLYTFGFSYLTPNSLTVLNSSVGVMVRAHRYYSTAMMSYVSVATSL